MTSIETTCQSCNKSYRLDSKILKKEQTLFRCKACGAIMTVIKPHSEARSSPSAVVTPDLGGAPKGLFGGLSIKFKFTIPFLALIIAAMAITGYISVRTGTNMATDFATNLLDQTSTKIMGEIRTYLAKPHLINEINANMLRDNLLDPTKVDDFLRFFWRQGNAFPGFGTIAFANRDGDLYGANAPENYLVIADKVQTGGAIRRYPPDPNGFRIDKVLREKKGYDATTRGWYKTAVAAQKPVWTEIEPSVTGQRLDSTAVYPFTLNGQLKGVFFVDVSLVEISNYLKNLKIGKTGQAFIFEKSGDVIAGTTITKPFVVKPDKSVERLKPANSDDPLLKAVYNAVAQDAAGLSHIQKVEQTQIGIKGETHFLQMTPFKDNFGIEWIVFVLVPESDYSPAAAIRNVIIGVWAIVLLLAIGIGWVIGNNLAKPIKGITNMANLVSQGKSDLEVLPETRRDEIGELIASFNRLVVSLRLAMTSWEQKS